jgi:hypothetical protein
MMALSVIIFIYIQKKLSLLPDGYCNIKRLMENSKMLYLNGENFTTFLEDQILIENWRKEYNHFISNS